MGIWFRNFLSRAEPCSHPQRASSPPMALVLTHSLQSPSRTHPAANQRQQPAPKVREHSPSIHTREACGELNLKGRSKIRVHVFTVFPLKVLCGRNKNKQQLIKSTKHCFPSNTKAPNENKRVTFNSRRGKAWDKKQEWAAIISHQHQSILGKNSITGLFILLRKGME